jgi:hypothetical protein
MRKKLKFNTTILLLLLLSLQSCEWIQGLTKPGEAEPATVAVENSSVRNEPAQPKETLKEEKSQAAVNTYHQPTILDFVNDVYLMANIKTINSVNAVIKCEILFFVQPKGEQLPEINFRIYNEESGKNFLDSTILITSGTPGIRYLPDNNLYEVNLGLKELGKNFKTRESVPSLASLNYIDVEPKRYNEIFSE